MSEITNLEDILNNKILLKPKDKMGVYFLIYKNEIIYIGSAIKRNKRLLMHIKNKKIRFDSYYFLDIKSNCENELRRLEIECIKKYKPIENIHHNSDYLTKEHLSLYYQVKKNYNSIHDFCLKKNISFPIAIKVLKYGFKYKFEEIEYNKIKNILFPDGNVINPVNRKVLKS